MKSTNPRFIETDVTFAVEERLGWDDINVFPESVYIEHDCDHEEPYVVDGHVFYDRKAVRYVPERTCRMIDCSSHDTCVVNSELSNGGIVSMEFGCRQCSECGAFVFDCPTVHYCPNRGARVEVE